MTSPLISPDLISDADRDRQVYRPQTDTRMLIDSLLALDLSGRRMLDLCTGSGAVALAGARAGADITAVDSCPHAVASVRRAAVDAGFDVHAVLSDLADVTDSGFDIVTCNPPYVLTPIGTESSIDGPRHAWNAGPDGRAVLDPLCSALPGLLAADGIALLVQSELADVDTTLAVLRATGLRARIVRRQVVPFGPVMNSRRQALVDGGQLDSTIDTESLVVVRAERISHDPGTSS
ncbi:HemK2/MTQ2 family protein methyltransferase [Gordonia neofelifaecis]|uniref:Putative methyltransferase n=1 Tax=Gordonia neofelifaecis NRRL B-59395 TaxID=644548 RepID=F1YPQ6_9ACTN|nr:HemK2/MTQ2 family protein methyltransferase [Gordonia neofelifaecis]EGD53335.1 putative methyltransferase [Gordonia neofelifaecis NRRL B-59395]